MPRTPECTARNHQIAELVAHGYTQQEVADKFGISQQRVDQISKRDVRRKVQADNTGWTHDGFLD